MGCIESSRNRENFCTSCNRMFMKLWLPPFQTMRSLIRKLAPCQGNSRSKFGQQTDPHTSFRCKKSCLFSPPVKNKNKINFKTLKAEKFFEIYA